VIFLNEIVYYKVKKIIIFCKYHNGYLQFDCLLANIEAIISKNSSKKIIGAPEYI